VSSASAASSESVKDIVGIVGIDHVQVAIPRDGEARARAFYGETLGLREVTKPEALVGRGGAWYTCGGQALHLGLDPDFKPQRKGHPALLVDDLAALRARLERLGAPVVEDAPLPGYARFYTADPFGNRIELLQPLGGQETEEADAIKARVRDTFSRTAEAYVASPGHAAGDDLVRLLAFAAPRPTDRTLDVSTGGGHTALALAPRVARVTASDLTPRMLAAARAFLTEKGVTNAEFVVADAERLPFLDAAFELVTVRIAPHHYADATRAVAEMARVLVPGGRLAVIDNIAPDDPELDAVLNDWERRRDPSHVRAYTVAEWQRFLAAAGLEVRQMETGRKAHPFASWAARTQMPDAARERLESDMLAAPAHVRDFFAVRGREGRVESWATDYLIALSVKPV
jgi:ubiquinone/menaquinone biosynthesis C-methylase UbiE/catechol 2,3-dioxygenase-like lactoylglutathione lyase family enzyme